MTPRDLVTRRIAARASSFPNFDLTPLDTAGLDSRDAALARAIDHAVNRRWLTLSAVLDTRLDQAWSDLQPTVQAPLLVGAAQLLLLERLPDHAVINEAVEWTKHNARRKAGGLVNAVLRRVAKLRGAIESIADMTVDLPQDVLPLDDGRAMSLTERVFDANPVVRLAQQTAHNDLLIGYWIKNHGRDEARRLALHSLVHPPIIITGVSAAASPHLQAHDEREYFVYTGPLESLDDVLASSDHARVQDPATGRAMMLTANSHPRFIIDFCAGRGTKTRQLAQLHPEATIIATDIDAARHAVLAETFRSHDRVQVVAFSDVKDFREKADLVVLDVPCSNTGVLARRVEAKYRINADTLATVRDMQRQIVADAIPLLAPQAHLLYATCSIEPVENDQQTQWITHWHPLHVIDEVSTNPTGLPGDPPTSYTDGGYAALMSTAGR